MKTIYTHVNPHLDDVCAIWLLQRFTADWKIARVKFLSARMKPQETSRSAAYIGIGRGKYDEHKGDIGETATTLVWRDVKSHIKNPLDMAALEMLVKWAKREDLGQYMGNPERPFSMVIAVEQQWSGTVSNETNLKTSFAILDAILRHLRDRAIVERDWKNRLEFKTKWGRGVALATSSRGVSVYAYEQGFVLCARVDKKQGFRGISAHAGSRVDLTAAAAKLRTLDPHAEWYLHHSKKLLLSGSRVAPGMKVSKLPLEKLIEVVRE